MATRFFCDSDCELWYTDIEELGIDIIKMPYVLDGVEYEYDFGKETDLEHFYKRVKEGSVPTTSALNEFKYTEIFEPVFANGEDIFYIAFSSNLSATFEFMNHALKPLMEKYPERKFTHFDTKSISVGAGIQVYYAMKLHNEGKSDAEVLAFLQGFTKEIKTIFAVDDLHHLKRGGRLSGAAAAVGTLLNLKPILKINDEGKLEVVTKVKGKNLVYKFFVDEFNKYSRDLDKYDAWILHADCPDRAEELESRLMEASKGKIKVRKIIVGPVIGAHCGAGTLGLIFHSSER